MTNIQRSTLMLTISILTCLSSARVVAQASSGLFRGTTWGMSSQQVRELETRLGSESPTTVHNELHYKATLLEYPAEVVYFFGVHDSLVAIELHVKALDSTAATGAYTRLASVLTDSVGKVLPGIRMSEAGIRFLPGQIWRGSVTDASLHGYSRARVDTSLVPESRESSGGYTQANVDVQRADYLLVLEFRSRILARPFSGCD
jgi:hypothetical protein